MSCDGKEITHTYTHGCCSCARVSIVQVTGWYFRPHVLHAAHLHHYINSNFYGHLVGHWMGLFGRKKYYRDHNHHTAMPNTIKEVMCTCSVYVLRCVAFEKHALFRNRIAVLHNAKHKQILTYTS